MKNIKEKIISSTGSISGVASILGSWQVCHNVCLGLIALLSVIGITIVGMPLEFLTRIAIPLWTFAFLLLIITLLLYIKKKCISKNLIIVNSGLIIAGVPFQAIQKFSIYFWIIGGLLATFGIFLFIKNKINKKGCKECKNEK